MMNAGTIGPIGSLLCHRTKRAVQRVCLPRYSLYPRRLFALLLPANHLSRIQTQLVRPRSISNAGQVFDQSTTVVKLRDDDDGENFQCDEEPHMLAPELLWILSSDPWGATAQ